MYTPIANPRANNTPPIVPKNFNGSKTINGADVAATLYSVIESCKKSELDPVDYMKYVITENHAEREPLTPLKYAKSIRSHQ